MGDYGEGCAGWSFVYDSSGTDQFQCWLKPTLGNKDPNSWPFSANDISGLGKAELQLQGQQVEDCYECHSHGYTGYNNRDNGPSDGQWNEPVYGTNDDWWQCAKKCDDYGEGCAGWTFVYDIHLPQTYFSWWQQFPPGVSIASCHRA